MASSASKIKLNGFNDLFGSPEEEKKNDSVKMICLDDLHSFKNHPFQVVDNEQMNELVESIRELGVLTPGEARTRPEGGYELLSGHRRKRACFLAGLDSMPVRIRECTDDEAVLYMVDANIQREEILPSEKAKAYKMKYDAMVHQGSKGNGRTINVLGEQSGESGKQVQRYIRLTELLDELLDMVDNRKILFIPAVELSYLTREEQELLLEKIRILGCYPNLAQSKQLKQYSSTGELTSGVIDLVLKQPVNKEGKISLVPERVNSYFPKGTTRKEIETVIYELLEKWKEGGGDL